MKLIHIQETNLHLLHQFIDKNTSKHFRYFEKRDITCIQNHIYTVILQNNENEIMGYAHIDYESGIHWVAICVLEDYQRKGHGKYLLQEIIDFAQQNNTETLQLSVDVDNSIALHLYLKQGFIIENITSDHYVMKKTFGTMIEVPVSMGECVDKLSILEIKKQFIKDKTKRELVLNEISYLHHKLNSSLKDMDYYYKLLIQINKKIWVMQDVFRDSKDKDQKQQLCLDIIDYNDRRFRIKNKINFSTQSVLKEVKGYNPKKCFILSHLGMGDHLTAVGMVRYLSTLYDEITVVCKDKNKKNVEELYSNDETIRIYPVANDGDISPRYGCPTKRFKDITQDNEVFLVGYHNLNRRPFDVNKLPFCFYEQMNLPATHMWEFFDVPSLPNAYQLYEHIKGKKFIFVHNTSSEGEVFSTQQMRDIMNSNHTTTTLDNYILINPNQNMYDTSHPNYAVAETLKGHSILSYKLVIENADFVFVSDSSFFCLAFQLFLKGDHHYLIQRASTNYANYEHIWSNTYKYKDYGRKPFKQVFP